MDLKEFVNPPKQNRPIPVWSLNDTMEPAEIENRIREMKKKGMGGFFMRSSLGLRTKYLSDDWMTSIRRSVEIAREVGMECWLSDEDRGPSGFCGGKTTERKEENLAVSLTWTEDASSLDGESLNTVVAYTLKDEKGKLSSVTEKPADLTGVGAFYIKRAERGNALFNGENYVDLLNPETVKDYIENTYERYATLYRYDFGENMPGIYTDRPTFDRSMFGELSFPWTLGFSEYFEKLQRYSLPDNLHHLLDDAAEGFKFRNDFVHALTERFIETYIQPVSKWCNEHTFKLTGNLSATGKVNPDSTSVPVMALYEYFDVPGVVHKGRKNSDTVAIKQVTSVANQLAKSRSFCEVFGSAGNGLTFEEMKRIANYPLALGITSLSPSQITYSAKGDRKREAVPTFSYHQPYYEHLRVLNDYLGRCSWAVSRGRSAANVLIMEPTDSVSFSSNSDANNDISSAYSELISDLLAEHVAFDCGDERIVDRHGLAAGEIFEVGDASYDTVVLPASFNWRASTIEKLEAFSGTIIIIGDKSVLVNGIPDNRFSDLQKRKNVILVSGDGERKTKTIIDSLKRTVSITGKDGAEDGAVLVNHRIEAAAHMMFITNTSTDDKKDITLTVDALGGVVELDPLTGRAFRYDSSTKDGKTIITTSLNPSGSRIFLIDQTQTSVTADISEFEEEALFIEGPFTFKKLNENTLVLDRCTLEMDGEKLLDKEPVVKAKRLMWKKTGIDAFWGYQPWAIEERNIRTRTNNTVLTFAFSVTDVPEKCALVMECGDKYTVAINGNDVTASYGKWHIDKKFSEYNIVDHLVMGENIITAKTDYLWDTEIESVYLCGDFAIGSSEENFPLITEPETLNTESWTLQGYPFYSGAMKYTIGFDLEIDDTLRYDLDLAGIKGSNIAVTVNGTEIGSVPFSPYRADITDALKTGENSIELEVCGTLRNTLGPHHNCLNDTLDRIDSKDFQDEVHWTDSYNFVPYGCVESPKLVTVTRK